MNSSGEADREGGAEEGRGIDAAERTDNEFALSNRPGDVGCGMGLEKVRLGWGG